MSEEKIMIPYTELKHLISQEVRLKNRVAELEDEIEGLEYDNHRLKMELFEERNQLIEEDELLDD
ncbi:hypothetical protein RNS76_07325 [Staphylococcus pseudintermedius]|uniref:hypothetical protein n=1 Tax=Staphylococcus pseudintermedius TaxID=283734 RepID=UPI0027E92D62|nr:hypothetical protein [Staphylococcus pseudintermedius]MDT0979387.1 hypothetical protein [Staphylococcus pseudintermedius]HDT9086086.1 hypothetical protein [Staphylococcus pseudintermedius]